VPADAQRRALQSLAGQVDRRALHDSGVRSDAQTVYVEVTGSVDFSLLNLLSPGDSFEITVRATARPQPFP
jgi:hypothetical protein